MTTFDVASYLTRLRESAARKGIDVRVMAPSRRRMTIDGHSTQYLDWGSTSQPPVLFLHGGGLSSHTFDLVCLQLRQEYWCLAPDLRGHGESDWSPALEYRIEYYVKDLAGMIDDLALQQVVLVGHSLGGLTALSYAASHAERVRGLALLDVGPTIQAAGAGEVIEFMRSTREFASLEDLIDRALALNPRRERDLLQASLARKVRQRSDGMWTWKHDLRRYEPGVGETPESLERLWPHVREVQCPTLVLRGADSKVFLADDAVTLTRTLQQGRLETIPDAGHTVQGDKPVGVATALRPFLRQVWGSTQRLQ